MNGEGEDPAPPADATPPGAQARRKLALPLAWTVGNLALVVLVVGMWLAPLPAGALPSTAPTAAPTNPRLNLPTTGPQLTATLGATASATPTSRPATSGGGGGVTQPTATPIPPTPTPIPPTPTIYVTPNPQS